MSGQPCVFGCTCRRHTVPAERTKGPFAGVGPVPAARHGTHSGYVTHRRHGQEPCEPCRAAHAEWARAEYLRMELDFSLTHAEALERVRSRSGQTSGSGAGQSRGRRA